MNKVRFIFGGTFNPPHYGHIFPLLELAEKFNLTKIELMPNKVPAYKPQPEVSEQQRLEMLNLIQTQYPTFVSQPVELLQTNTTTYTAETLTQLKQSDENVSIVFIMGTDSWLDFKKWHRHEEILKLCHIIVISRPSGTAQQFSSNTVPSDTMIEEDNGSKQLKLAKSFGLRAYISTSGSQDQVSLCHKDWRSNNHGSITFVETKQLDISSSEIRALIQSGKNLASIKTDSKSHFIDYANTEGTDNQHANNLYTKLPDCIINYIRQYKLYGC